MKFWRNPANALLKLWRSKTPVQSSEFDFQSKILERDVTLAVYLPPEYDWRPKYQFPFVLFNDGQDLPRMNPYQGGFKGILEELFSSHEIPSVVCIGIYTSNQRIREYGTARQADYKGRGDLAGRYTQFVLEELLPFLYRHYRLSDLPEDRAIAGFSLGGLSAFDIAWANPTIFGHVGVFSGALWWRSKAVDPADPDADRIMHDIVHQSNRSADAQRFWFQCGTLDEDEDRNHNGVIDAIDDTLDLIKAIRAKGFREEAIRYLEIKDGHHDPNTWAEAMPDFLRWVFVTDGD